MASLPSKLDANRRFDFELKGASFDKDTFAVIKMTGVESISRPFEFTLTLVSDKANIDFDATLTSSATFRIFAPDGLTSTPYYGVLSQFEQLHQADGYSFYRAVLVPRLWKLSQYQISEVYLDKTAAEMIKEVLNTSRLSNIEFNLTGSYRQRSYVCQYQETHLDFLSRWMEKEGMYFYFDHDGGSDKLVIIDAKSMQPAKVVIVNYRPIDQLDTAQTGNSVQGFICRQKPLSNKVVLQDYNYRKANLTLRVEEIISAQGTGDVMLYGENFRDSDEGKRYAKIRAEEIRCGGKVFYGEATAVGLRSGYLMKLTHHFRDDFNDEYLITEVTHEGSQAGALLTGIKHPFTESGATHETETTYRNTFRAIPASVQFRAERITTKPRISGTMTATIDAEGSGQYAELDGYGQYKVQLPFDQTDKPANKSSARVRMISPYSGSDHGMHFPLHKNAEVVLSFINGDPDQPIILGAVPNSENVNVVNNTNFNQSVMKINGDLNTEVNKNSNGLIYGYDHLMVLGAGLYTTTGLSTRTNLGGSVVTTLGLANAMNIGPTVINMNHAGFIGNVNNAVSMDTVNKATGSITESCIATQAEKIIDVAERLIETFKAGRKIQVSYRAPWAVFEIEAGTIEFSNTSTGTDEHSKLSIKNEGTKEISIVNSVSPGTLTLTNRAKDIAIKTVASNSIKIDVFGDVIAENTGNVITTNKGAITTTNTGKVTMTNKDYVVTDNLEDVRTTNKYKVTTTSGSVKMKVKSDVTTDIEGDSMTTVVGLLDTKCGSQVTTVNGNVVYTSELITFT